jgi:nitroreductase
VVAGREYFLFDTGMSTAFLILRATELGLVVHPMAGFSESKAIEVLGIPEDMTLISLLAVGKKAREINDNLNDKQKESELSRPERLGFDQYVFLNQFS